MKLCQGGGVGDGVVHHLGVEIFATLAADRGCRSDGGARCHRCDVSRESDIAPAEWPRAPCGLM